MRVQKVGQWWSREGNTHAGYSAAVQCISGALDASVSYLEAFSWQRGYPQQSQCWALGQKTRQERIPKRIVPENISILYIHWSLWTYLFKAITRYLFVKAGQDLEWVYPDLLGLCFGFPPLKSKVIEDGDAGVVSSMAVYWQKTFGERGKQSYFFLYWKILAHFYLLEESPSDQILNYKKKIQPWAI